MSLVATQSDLEDISLEAPRLLLSGLDSLYVSFWLDAGNSLLDWAALQCERDRVKLGRRDSVEVQLGSETFALLPHGRNKYPYVLTNRAFTIQLAERMQPCCHVQFSSEALWHEGLDQLETRLRTWFRSMAALPTRPEVVSRADWAFDFHLPAVDFGTDDFVTRVRKDATYRDSGLPQTFRLGQGEVVIRVYDKVAEIAQQSGKVWLFRLWGRESDVWRVEFQVRGDRLRQGGIRTLDDLRGVQADLLRELGRAHTTLRRPTGDSNRSRWPLHPLWLSLHEAIDALPQTGIVRAFDPETELELRLARQCRSLYGNLKGIGALLSVQSHDGQPFDLEDVLEMLTGLLRHEHSDTLWRNDIVDRMQRYWLGRW